MKVNMTLDINVAMGGASNAGTGFRGYMPEGTRYEDLVRVFGEPQLGASQDGKIKAEWIGRINELVFTIYDYKSKLEPQQNTNWHIGGKLKLAAELVIAYFNEQVPAEFPPTPPAFD
ncbi:MAG: hypothetical protein ABIH47_09080 [Candidatus Omnitrophota bacterium]